MEQMNLEVNILVLQHYFQQAKVLHLPHFTTSQDKFVEGEATIIELSGVYKRYHAPMARNSSCLENPFNLIIVTLHQNN
jgi:Xaa-Pro aminopeptidase